MELRKGELYIDSNKFILPVSPPQISEAVYPLDKAHVDRISLCKGDVQMKGGSHFIGYSVTINSVADVRAAYTKVKRTHPNALHIACAYRLPGVNFVNLRGYEDDDEHGAGYTIYKVLEDKNVFNKAVYVVRHFGNKHIGPVRFQLISAATKTALAHACSDGTREKELTNTQRPVAPATSMERRPLVEPRFNVEQTVSTMGPSDNRNQGYVNATSPQPFLLAKSSWGSHDSVNETLPNGSVQNNHPRANSWGSSTSFSSCTSIK